jgi:hypothetical protein
VSVSQINRVRAALGVSNHPGRSPHEKNRQGKEYEGAAAQRASNALRKASR